MERKDFVLSWISSRSQQGLEPDMNVFMRACIFWLAVPFEPNLIHVLMPPVFATQWELSCHTGWQALSGFALVIFRNHFALANSWAQMSFRMLYVVTLDGPVSGQVPEEADVCPCWCDGLQCGAVGQLWEGEEGAGREDIRVDQTDWEQEGRDWEIQIRSQTIKGHSGSCAK